MVKKLHFAGVLLGLGLIPGVYFSLAETPNGAPGGQELKIRAPFEDELKPPTPYIPPSEVKGIYLTSETVLGPQYEEILKMLIETELNSVVINVNDGVDEAGLERLAKIVSDLNSKSVHTIARIVVFQSHGLIKKLPQAAIKTKDGQLWHDQGGEPWLDPASQDVWQEILKLSRQTILMGFREINYDYIRFPSNGKFGQAVYPVYKPKTPKHKVINGFGKFLKDNLKKDFPEVILSVDIFAHTIFVTDDAGIGQKFTEIVDHFDVTCPMVYPSHYKAGHFGQENPAANPYPVVLGTMKLANKKLAALKKTPVIRPWLQDFSLGAKYTPELVKKEIKAVKDAGYKNGWLLWNARNVYNHQALLKSSN